MSGHYCHNNGILDTRSKVCYNNAMNWYVVSTKGGEEPRAAAHLSRQAFEVFLPTVANGKKALFPRYLFVRFDPKVQPASKINNSRGVHRLVTFGDALLPLPDSAIDLIQQRLRPAASSPMELGNGDTVKVVLGPFAGVQAIFDEPDGEKRSFLLIDLLGSQHRVAVANSHLS